MQNSKNGWSFAEVAKQASNLAGSSLAFAAACGVVLAWAISGPIFGFSDTWQLVINTARPSIFLMVFLLQSTQNRDARALHLKLDELLRSVAAATD
jgi:low affinity Fe/Cu permease